MKTLVLAEKPSVGRDIARVLHCARKGDGYLEGTDYVVTWGLGHLVELQPPEGYDPKYREWRSEDLPIMPERFETSVIPQTGKQYKTVRSLLQRKDVRDVVIATDAGREGELVARWILQKAGCAKPCRRLWISSVTDKAIREGFARLRDAKEYDNLYRAALSRAEADWLVGLNATRALTCRYNAQLSCGRVQTPTLAMIAKREEEIRSFQPKPYYTVQAEAGAVRFQWRDASGSMRTFSRERAEAVCAAAKGGSLTVTAVERKKKQTQPPLLYDLTELQRDANRRFGYSAKETLNVLQRLYETHKVVTYPRTDSRYLTADIVMTIRERLDACGTGPYRAAAGKAKRRPLNGKLPFVNDAKVTDHHALIPTEQPPEFRHMTIDERRLYDLVVRRFLAVLYPPYEYEEMTVHAKIGGEEFLARGRTVLREGWREAYRELPEADAVSAGRHGVGGRYPGGAEGCAEGRYLDGAEKYAQDSYLDDTEEGVGEAQEELRDQLLPEVRQGERLSVRSASCREGKTKPPAHFRESTLLSAMENPAAFLTSGDRLQAKTLAETGGLGTVATRADIIDKLFGSFLLEKKGRDILLTAKARQLLSLVPKELRQPELTADWELRLAQIADGRMRRDVFMREIRDYTRELLREINTQEGTYRHENLTNKKCPDCGKRLLAVNGKNAKLLVCQDRACGYREIVSRTSNARCPNCHKKMELVGSGEQAKFVCGCGYKELLSHFKERRAGEGAGVTKRDVAAYMKKQQRAADEPVNNTLAAALAGIRLE